MTTAVQLRRGTTAEHATFTGLEGETTVDTTKDTLVVHNGSTAGGFPIAREDLANVSPTNLPSITGDATAADDTFLIYDQSALTLKKITRAELNNAMEQDPLANVQIISGTINGTTIGGTTAAGGSFTTLNSSGATTLNGTTIPSSVTLVSTAATQTLTNKTITFANNTLTGVAPLASPALTGTPTAPTAAAGTNTTQVATTAHVFAERTNTATLTNKTLTSPTINTPTVSGGTINNTVIGGTTASTGTFTTLTADNIIAPNVAAIGQFSWDNNATTTPVAKPEVTPSSTLLASIHGRMRGCLLLDNGQVNYYLNPTNWAQKEDGSASVLTGADGMVMVEIPAFYVKNESSGTLWKPVISATPLPGYDLHPAFIKDGTQVPYRYYSAYDACVFDVSASAYIAGLNLDNATSLVDTGADKLASVSGVYPMVGLTRNEFRLLAANRGTGWRVGDFTLWSAIGILMAVEAQTLNSQGVYGAGNTGNSYFSSSSNQNDSPHTIAGAGNALGNGSTDTTSGASNTNRPGTSYCKYRGIENFWGNCWNWTDGINIFSEGNTAGNKVFAYWSNNRANFADDTATNYGLLGEIANTLNNNRYGTQFSQDNVWALVTTGFSTTSTHGTSDFLSYQ
jgi:hypothetical protein